MRRSGIIIVILVILALTVNGGCAWMGTPQPSPAAAPPPTTTEASLPSITTPTPPEPSESPVAARETPTPPPTTQTIRIAVWNADMARMTVWRRAWEARHPDILIDIIPIETVADDLLRSSNGSAPSLRAIGEAVSARADVFPTMPWVDLHPDLVADLSALPLPDDAMLKGARERWMTPSIMRTRMTMGVRVRMAAVRASVDRPQDESIWTWQDALRRATPNAPAFDPTAGAAALGGVLIASGIDVAGWSDRVPEADVAAVARSARAVCQARADRRLTFRADTDQPFLWGVDLPLADQGSALAPWPRPWTPPIVPEPIAFSVARTAPQPLAWQALRALFADADRWLPNDVLPLSASAARRHPVWDRLDENRRAVVVQAAMRADPPLPPRIAEALRSIVESVCDQNRDAVQSVRSIVMTPDAPSPDAPVAGGASPSTPPESDASLRPLRIAIATLDPSMRDRVAAILSAQGRRPIWVDQESGVATPSDLASRSDCAIMPWDSTMRRVPFDGRDLTPWIQQNPRIIEDLRPQAAALMRSSSERPWFLPLAASPSLLVYRASSVRDLKLNPPTSEWTWNDLRASSDAVFRASGGQRYGYVPFGALGSDALRFLRAHRAPATVIERDHRIRVRYDRSDVIDALMTYRAPVEPLMRHASGRFLDLDGTSSDAMIALIADGRATFWTATPEWFNADDPDLRFAPPPLADAALPEDLNITIGMIPTASSDPDACWRLLSTLTADKSGSPGVIPASRRTPPPASPYADAMVAVMDRALPIAPDDATLAIPLTPFWLWSALDADIDEDARPMRIMTAAYLAIAWVDCVGGRLPVSPNQGLACAQKLDPQHVNALVPSGRHESFPADIGD
jgi:ABC-type glycerol-3-phosphate transport system substrate-binding protein